MCGFDEERKGDSARQGKVSLSKAQTRPTPTKGAWAGARAMRRARLCVSHSLRYAGTLCSCTSPEPRVSSVVRAISHGDVEQTRPSTKERKASPSLPALRARYLFLRVGWVPMLSCALAARGEPPALSLVVRQGALPVVAPGCVIGVRTDVLKIRVRCAGSFRVKARAVGSAGLLCAEALGHLLVLAAVLLEGSCGPRRTLGRAHSFGTTCTHAVPLSLLAQTRRGHPRAPLPQRPNPNCRAHINAGNTRLQLGARASPQRRRDVGRRTGAPRAPARAPSRTRALRVSMLARTRAATRLASPCIA